jgi:2-polyprenyl-3-methyl-5-hydroxy-6-metoxy-1,4-benzoquinol methylase
VGFEGEAEAIHRAWWLQQHQPAVASIIDIGCGSGLLITRELIRRGFDITGVDWSPVKNAETGAKALVFAMLKY